MVAGDLLRNGGGTNLRKKMETDSLIDQSTPYKSNTPLSQQKKHMQQNQDKKKRRVTELPEKMVPGSRLWCCWYHPLAVEIQKTTWMFGHSLDFDPSCRTQDPVVWFGNAIFFPNNSRDSNTHRNSKNQIRATRANDFFDNLQNLK